MALELLANCYGIDRNVAAASSVNGKLISDFAGTIHEKHSRLNLFFLFYNSKLYSLAREQLTTLRASYPTEEMVAVASWLMSVVSEGASEGVQQQAEQAPSQQRAVVNEKTVSMELSNYPNPFNPSTIIRFTVPEAGHVSLKVFDLLGREIATLLNEERAAGTHRVSFDAGRLPSGVYFYKLESAGKVAIQKMVLAR